MSDKDDWTGALAALEALGRAAQERKLHRFSSLSIPLLNSHTPPTSTSSSLNSKNSQTSSVAFETTSNRAPQAKQSVDSPVAFKLADEPHYAWVADDADIKFTIRTVKGGESLHEASLSSATFETSVAPSKPLLAINNIQTTFAPSSEAAITDAKRRLTLESRQLEEETEVGLAFVKSGAATTLTSQLDSYYIPSYVLQPSKGAEPLTAHSTKLSQISGESSRIEKSPDTSSTPLPSRQEAPDTPAGKRTPSSGKNSRTKSRLMDLDDPTSFGHVGDSKRRSRSSQRLDTDSSSVSNDRRAADLVSSGSSIQTEANGVSTPDTSHSSIHGPLTNGNSSKMELVDDHPDDELLKGSRVKRNHLAVEAENIAAIASSSILKAYSPEATNKRTSKQQEEAPSTSNIHRFVGVSAPVPPTESHGSTLSDDSHAHPTDANSDEAREASLSSIPVDHPNAHSRPASPTQSEPASEPNSLKSSTSSLRFTKTGKGLVLRLSSQSVSTPSPEEKPASDAVPSSIPPEMDAIAPGMVLVPDAENEDIAQEETSMEPFIADDQASEQNFSGYEMPNIVDDISLSALDSENSVSSANFDLSRPDSPMMILPTLPEEATPSSSGQTTPESSVHSEDADVDKAVEEETPESTSEAAQEPRLPSIPVSPTPIEPTTVMDYSQYDDAGNEGKDAESLLLNDAELSMVSSSDSDSEKESSPSESALSEPEATAEGVDASESESEVVIPEESPVASESHSPLNNESVEESLAETSIPTTPIVNMDSAIEDDEENIIEAVLASASIPTTPIVNMDSATNDDTITTEAILEDPAESVTQAAESDDEEASAIEPEPTPTTDNAMDVDLEAPIIDSNPLEVVDTAEGPENTIQVVTDAPNPPSASPPDTTTSTAATEALPPHTDATPLEATDIAKTSPSSPKALVAPVNPTAADFRSTLLTASDPYYKPAYRNAAITYDVIVTLLEQHVTSLNAHQFKKTSKLLPDSVCHKLFGYLTRAPLSRLDVKNKEFFELLTDALSKSVASSTKPAIRQSFQTRALFVLYYCRHGLMEMQLDHERWKASAEEKRQISRNLALPVGKHFTFPFSWRCFCTFSAMIALKALQIGADKAAAMTDRNFARPSNCVVKDEFDDSELVALELFNDEIFIKTPEAPTETNASDSEILSLASSTATSTPPIVEEPTTPIFTYENMDVDSEVKVEEEAKEKESEPSPTPDPTPAAAPPPAEASLPKKRKQQQGVKKKKKPSSRNMPILSDDVWKKAQATAMASLPPNIQENLRLRSLKPESTSMDVDDASNGAE